jgi:cell division protein FtsL
MNDNKNLRIKEKPNSNKNHFSLRLFFLCLLVICFALLYVRIKVEIIKFGYEISTNKKKEEQLLKDNHLLHAECMELKSPARIEDIARESGFRFPTQEDVIYIKDKTVIGEIR